MRLRPTLTTWAYIGVGFWLSLATHMLAAQQILCGVILPPQLETYRNQIERQFGSIVCDISAEAHAEFRHGHPRIYTTIQGKDDTPIILHEMMHLWLKTQGWDVSDDPSDHRFKAPTPEMQSVVDQTSEALEDYIEHLAFQKILDSADVNSQKEIMEWAHNYINSLKNLTRQQPVQIAPVSAVFLDIRRRNKSAGKELADYLISHNASIAVTLADDCDEEIRKIRPDTQTKAHTAVQHCIDIAFWDHEVYREGMTFKP